ncbi:NAD(P)/FAD-dependent oxidoreductase [Sphingomonas sp. RS2018]
MRATVVGGGIVGLCAAVELARSGLAVTVLEQDPGRAAASWNNAGHIAIEQVAPLASLASIRSAPGRRFGKGGALDLPRDAVSTWLPFAARMLAASLPRRFAHGSAALGALLQQAMPAWTTLTDDIDGRDLLRADGHFVAWESDASASAGRSAWAAADTGTAGFTDATPGELAWLQTLSPAVHDAIRFTGSGQVTDLAALADRLEAALQSLGGRIEHRHATLHLTDGKAAIDGDEPDVLLVSAGVRSAALLAPLGHRAPMIAERGYHLRAAATDWPADLPPVVFEDRSMVVTRYADCVQAASFVELNRVDAPPDPRKWERLERHVADLGLPVRGPYRRWIGARPTLPDYLPAIGRSTRAANLLYAFGHQHVGLTLAPITARIVGALARGETPPVAIGPFDITRFG